MNLEVSGFYWACNTTVHFIHVTSSVVESVITSQSSTPLH